MPLTNRGVQSALSRRSFARQSTADSWEEIWEAGPYFDRVAQLLEGAQEYVILVGWQIDSRLLLPGPQGQETLQNKLIRLCETRPDFHAYLLMWDHATFYMVEREFLQGRIWDEAHSRIHFVFDNRHPFGGSHHEKICLIDGNTTLCGGIDLCDERWDSPSHLYHDSRRSLDRRREHHGPYHDIGLQLTGPICAEIHRHVARRWNRISSTALPHPRSFPAAIRRHTVYLSRTLARIDPVQNPKSSVTREIEFLFRDLIRSAEKRIILEGQYYWSEELNDALISKMIEMRGQDFEIILVVANLRHIRSLTRTMTNYELALLDRIEKTAQFTGCRLILGSPYAYSTRGRGPAKPIYVHSKVLVVDDRFLSIGSANFAARAFRLDSEIHLTLEAKNDEDRAHVRKFSEQLLFHWGISPETRAAVEVRRLRPSQQLFHSRGDRIGREPPAPWRTWIPYHRLFDPKMPILYPLKRRVFNLVKRNRVAMIPTVVMIALLGAIASFFIARQLGTVSVTFWTLLYTGLLSSTWILPIPFLGLSIVAAWHLGGETASCLAVSSLWVSALLAYGLSRMFPTAATYFCRWIGLKRSPHRLRKVFAERNFSSLLSVLFDPRIDLRAKLISQGIACVPFPWFALACLLVLPAGLQLFLRCAVAILAGLRAN